MLLGGGRLPHYFSRGSIGAAIRKIQSMCDGEECSVASKGSNALVDVSDDFHEFQSE